MESNDHVNNKTEKKALRINPYLTEEEKALADKLSKELRESKPGSRTPELLYLGFLKDLEDRRGVEEDLKQLKQMIYDVSYKMEEIMKKVQAKSAQEKPKTKKSL